MISQIIFFVAIALLLVLLIRRVRDQQNWVGKVGQALYRFGQTVARVLQAALGGLTQRMRRRAESPTERMSANNQTAPGHQFWREEPSLEKFDLASHFEEGDQLLKEKKYPQAEQFFLKAAAQNPKDAKVYARLGLIYLQQKNYSDAIEALKVAAKLDKHNPSRHYNLALAYSGNQNVQQAIASVREAITLDPVAPKYRQLLEQLLNG